MKPSKEMQFLGDAVMAQEVALSLLINTLLKFHPEITADYLAGIDHVLTGSSIPTPGARSKLEGWRAAIATNQPKPSAAH